MNGGTHFPFPASPRTRAGGRSGYHYDRNGLVTHPGEEGGE